MYLKETIVAKKKFQGNNTRHWVSTLPKQTNIKTKMSNSMKTPWKTIAFGPRAPERLLIVTKAKDF